MAKQTINVGTNQDDGTGDLLRAAFLKVNENFTEVYTELGGTLLSNIRLIDSTISTDTSNSNLIIETSGTGKLQISGTAEITGNTSITGTLDVSSSTALASTLAVTGNSTLAALGATNITASGTLGVTGTSSLGVLNVSGASAFTGTATVNGLLNATGSVDLGNASADTITATGRFDSSLVPSTNNSKDLGSSSLRWATIYGTTLDVTSLSVGTTVMDQISIAGNKISSNASNASIELDPNGTGIVDIRSNVTLNGNTLTGNITGNVTGNVTSSGTSTFAAIDVNGGAIDGTPIGASSTSTGNFSAVVVDNISVNGATVETTTGQLFLKSATSNISASNNIISDLTNPVQRQDGATKAYVDDTVIINVVDDSSTLSVLQAGETLAIVGGTNITTAVSNDVLTITGPATQTLDSVTTVDPATSNTLTVGGLNTDGININGNEILTRRSNENLELIRW